MVVDMVMALRVILGQQVVEVLQTFEWEDCHYRIEWWLLEGEEDIFVRVTSVELRKVAMVGNLEALVVSSWLAVVRDIPTLVVATGQQVECMVLAVEVVLLPPVADWALVGMEVPWSLAVVEAVTMEVIGVL
jgi:hypothetical protein